MRNTLKIGGLTPFSSTDYPGMLAAVIFFQGCPWRCAYCHNPHLQARHSSELIEWETVQKILLQRRNLLDAVVFSGGEPTLQHALLDAVLQTKNLGYKIGLHTAGIYPKQLARLLPHVDWVGFDIKTQFADYGRITLASQSGERVRASAKLLLQSGVAHEFRTTVHPQLMSHTQLLQLAEELADFGVEHYALQEFRAMGCADSSLLRDEETDYLNPHLQQSIGANFKSFIFRSA